MSSIRTKLMGSIVMIIVLFTAALLIGNSFFLEKYYVYQTKNHFIESYEQIDEILKDSNDYKALQDIGRQTGYRLTIIDDKNNIVYSTDIGESNASSQISKTQIDYISEHKTYLNEKLYVYGVLTYDEKVNNDVKLVARIGQGKTIIITQPMKQLVENARIANSFSVIISIIMLLISISLAYFLSRHFVKPILEINDIAKNISELKFSMRYKKRGNDEIDHLGETINSISCKLAGSIDDLQDSNDRLKQEIKNQKEFFANVSHEIKTPVGIIRGYTEALKLGINPENEQDMKDIIINESDRLSNLLDEMINQIKISSGHFRVVNEKVQMAELVSECIETYRYSAEKRELDIVFDQVKPVELKGDYHRLRQVVDNLLSNAIKYAVAKSEINIKLEKKSNCIYFEIENHVSHIDVANIEIQRIYEPFYRARNNNDEKLKGNGLGLAVVKAIIEAHDGTCEAVIKNNKFKFMWNI